MYLPSVNHLDLLGQVLDALSVSYSKQESDYSPIMTFYFEGQYFWIVKKGEGFKLSAENAKALESFSKLFITAINPEENKNELD